MIKLKFTPITKFWNTFFFWFHQPDCVNTDKTSDNLKKSMNTYAQMLYLLNDFTVYEYKYKTFKGFKP